MKKSLCLIMAVLLLVTVFAGCSASNKIVGSWRYTEQTILNISTERTYTFNEDGTGSAPVLAGAVNVDMTYEIDGDTITINRGELVDAVAGAEVYTFSISGDTLTLTASDGSVLTLTKVK